MKYFYIFLTLVFTSFGQAQSPNIPTDPSIGETLFFIQTSDYKLETTLFKPDGAGPFPVAVINHGQASGNNIFQPRYRPIPAVRELLQRGYAVVVPMRRGFSRSEGVAARNNCDAESNGNNHAIDVAGVVEWIKKQAWADTTHMLMLGQSVGGLTTLAYMQNPDPGFKVFVNFAGGIKLPQCAWESSLKKTYGSFGAKTKVESLWFYGENESFFPPSVINPAYRAYVDAGGKAEFIAFGVFASDAHAMFGSFAGLPIWWHRVEARMTAAGLPTQVIHAKYALNRTARPAPSGFAAINDIAKLPNATDATRATYQRFLDSVVPRAFAINKEGAAGFAFGGTDPLKNALEFCNRRGKGDCQLYAVDNDVVWLEEDKH